MSESSEKQCVSFVCGLSILEIYKNVKYFYKNLLFFLYNFKLKIICLPKIKH